MTLRPREAYGAPLRCQALPRRCTCEGTAAPRALHVASRLRSATYGVGGTAQGAAAPERARSDSKKINRRAAVVPNVSKRSASVKTQSGSRKRRDREETYAEVYE
ncbi:unnamed protein product [Lampetra planeri]